MKLDRNVSADGRQKYGLIKNRRIKEILSAPAGDCEPIDPSQVQNALLLLERAGVIDWGDTPETEFFVMRLKDAHAGPALVAYASDAKATGDQEYANQVYYGLAIRAGRNHPNCKAPD